MAIDFEATSFGFARRQDFVEVLADAQKEVQRRLKHPGRESIAGLLQLDAAITEVLKDEVFEPHVRRMADRERDPEPAQQRSTT